MILTFMLLLASGSQDSAPKIKSPLPPEEAASHIKIDAGLRLELVASEPQIHSPVAMAFDADGTLYVVEMLDYPTPDPTRPPLGRIKALEDRDGDGRFEHARVFADRLMLANGLMPWRDGLIVTAAPHILHLRDTDGDGKADRREILYDGFAVKNPQLRVSHPNLGIDNWVYVANGARGGQIIPKGRTGAPVSLNGMDFRFDPVGARYETVSGYGQFGLTFDDWGQRFVCTNRNHLIHLPMPNRYFKRNTFLAPPGPQRSVRRSRR